MVALPVAADVRRLRSKLNVAIGTALGRVRGPALIALGAAGSTGALVRSLGRGPTSCPSRTEELREDPHTPMPASLTSQGEVTWNHLAARPEAADLMNWTALLAGALALWLEDTADELHDISEEALGRLDHIVCSRLPKAKR